MRASSAAGLGLALLFALAGCEEEATEEPAPPPQDEPAKKEAPSVDDALLLALAAEDAQALEKLKALGPEKARGLLDGLSGEDPKARKAAAFGVRAFPSDTSWMRLAQALDKEKDAEVIGVLARSLATSRSPQAIGALGGALDNPEQQAVLVQALATLDGESAAQLPGLQRGAVQAVKEGKGEERLGALKAVVIWKAPEAGPLVYKLAASAKHAETRIYALEQMRNFNDKKKALGAIKKSLKSKDAGVRLAAVHAAEDVGGKKAMKLLKKPARKDKSKTVKAAAKRALKKLKSEGKKKKKKKKRGKRRRR